MSPTSRAKVTFSRTTSVSRSDIAAAPLLLALLLIQLPLICDPGYFSHDELQWWARATVPAWRDLPWVAWADISVFQYRPLTFNLWLLLAHAFAATSFLMHLAFVLLGSLNASCVERSGRRLA